MAVLAAVIALAVLGLVVADPGPVTTLVGSMLGGMRPLITVVLAIDRLTLTQEFGTTGTSRERLDETDEFRRTVEETPGSRPVRYSHGLPPDARRGHSGPRGGLARGLRRLDDPERRERVRAFADEPDSADRMLEGATFGTFEVVSVILDYHDSVQLDETRALRSTREAAGRPEAVDDIEDLLEDVYVTRLSFKTVYIQQELADLSIVLLYVGFAALVGGGFVILSLDRPVELTANRALLTAVVAGAATVAVAPFAVLLWYVLRIATVARRTAADFGPFTLQREIPADQLEWQIFKTLTEKGKFS